MRPRVPPSRRTFGSRPMGAQRSPWQRVVGTHPRFPARPRAGVRLLGPDRLGPRAAATSGGRLSLRLPFWGRSSGSPAGSHPRLPPLLEAEPLPDPRAHKRRPKPGSDALCGTSPTVGTGSAPVHSGVPGPARVSGRRGAARLHTACVAGKQGEAVACEKYLVSVFFVHELHKFRFKRPLQVEHRINSIFSV